MNYNTPIQTFGRPASNIVYKHQVRRQKVLDLQGSMAVWRPVAKLILVSLPLLFAINLCLSLYQGKVDASIQAAEDARFELMNTHITLRAGKARLMSPGYVQVAAAEKLSLHVPRKGQVNHF